MKVAYLILAHRGPEQVKRLVEALDDPRFDIFLHIDGKTDIQKFRTDEYKVRHSKLTVLSKREKVYWGDMSAVRAMFSLYRCALKAENYDYFVLLSGEDYPVQHSDALCALLADGKERLIAAPLEGPGVLRVKGYWFWKLPKRIMTRALRKGLSLLGVEKRPYLTVKGERWEIWVASQWTALSRGCVEHFLTKAENNPEIFEYFRYSRAPDELVIPTIIMNTPEWRERTLTRSAGQSPDFEGRAGIHYLKQISTTASTVEIFDESAFDAAIASGKPFIRKVRPGVSDRLLDLLDQHRAGQ